jgi:cytoskeletal protein CcmA (bactofilin family)
MTSRYDDDWIDGRRVPQLVIDRDYRLDGTHVGTVHVEAGEFTLAGVLKGTLDIQPGVSARITGSQQGTVTIGRRSTVTVTGAIEGTTTVEQDSVLIVEAGGKLAGSLTNDGQVIVRGVFGGQRRGGGKVRLEDAGYIKQPVIRDGIAYYEW